MKTGKLYRLSPDTVALLQLCTGGIIEFEDVTEALGAVLNGDAPIGKSNGHARAAARRKLRIDAGRVTVDGVTVRSWRKGSHVMSRKAVLTTGESAPSKKINGVLLEDFKAVQGAMTRNEALGIPTVTRADATKALAKKSPGKTAAALSAHISYLFKYGYLREVVGKTPAAEAAINA